jgi:hypothetical protein
LAAVGLVADDDDLLAAAFDGGADVVDARSGSKALVGVGLDVEGPCELAAGLSRPQQRAREDDRRDGVLAEHPSPELTCLPAPFLRQRAQLVGVTRRGLGVADEVEAHDSGG